MDFFFLHRLQRIAFIATSMVAMVRPHRKRLSPSARGVGASAGPMKLSRKPDPPQAQVARTPIARVAAAR